MAGKVDIRKIEENIFHVLMIGSTLLVAASLFTILSIVAVKGFSSMSWEMLSQTPKGGYYLGGRGGILNAIVGSVYVGLGATVVALVLSLPVVFYMNVYVRRDAFTSRVVRFVMDLLWGVPSIVYGAFGFIVMLMFGMRASLGAAIITVAILELPIMIRGMDEVLRTIPVEIEEASYGLGATQFETAFKVVLRQALPGLVTAVLMAFGRAIGDTASVLFTAGFTDNIPGSLGQPAATLPLAIFFQLGTPFPSVQGRAYAAAAVLTVLVLAVSIVGRIAARYSTRHVVK